MVRLCAARVLCEYQVLRIRWLNAQSRKRRSGGRVPGAETRRVVGYGIDPISVARPSEDFRGSARAMREVVAMRSLPRPVYRYDRRLGGPRRKSICRRTTGGKLSCAN